MEKLIKVEFEGQSKAVIAKVKLEYTLDCIEDLELYTDEKVLEEAKKLYNDAHKHADMLTKTKFF